MSLVGFSTNILVYLCASAAFFVFGLLTTLTRRNAIGIFMGVELMLNAAAVNFVAFQAFKRPVSSASTWLDGHVFALFIIIMAAIEAAVALAIVLRVFAVKHSVAPEKATELRG